MEERKNTGGPAYPCNDIVARNEEGKYHGAPFSSPGMTLRDWFAGQALMGFRANTHAWEELTPEQMVKYAWEDADAMLAERDK